MYWPFAEIVPRLDALTVHITAVLLVPVTVAVNNWVAPGSRMTFAGETDTTTVTEVSGWKEADNATSVD